MQRARGCLLGLVCLLFWLLLGATSSRAQDVAGAGTAKSEGEQSSRLNTWSLAAEFVPTTQHYFLGQSEERRFFAIGGEYARRLKRGHIVDVVYVGELRPVILEGDPVLEGLKNPLTGKPCWESPIRKELSL